MTIPAKTDKMLLDNLEDADSTAAEQDFEDDREDEFGDMQDSSWMNGDDDDRSLTVGGPSDDYAEYDQEDDHKMYSDVRHVEDASMTSVDDHHDPPTVDIRLSDDSNTKMD